MTTRRQRKELEAQQSKDRDISERRERRLRWTAIGLGSVLTVTGGLITLWHHLPDAPGKQESGRDPASLDPSSPAAMAEKAKNDAKGKSLEELSSEIRDKQFKRERSKEWGWAESGRTDLVTEAYRSHGGKGSSEREERLRLLNILGGTLKPRKEWPRGFNDQRANELVEFFTGILTGTRGPGPEPVASVNGLAAVARLIPELRAKAERAIVAYYGAETRPGPKGDCIGALASFRSREGLRLAESAARGSDTAMVRTGIYALAEYVQDSELGEEARKALRAVAASNPTQRALAVKLLAHYGDRQIASMVPTLLRASSTPSEVEAGAYAVGRLKLKQYKDLLIERSVTEDPIVRREIDEAMRSLNQ